MYSKSLSVAFAATLFASASAHFFISSPVPIPGNAIKDPLDPSGSNFPCHGADITQGTVTPLTAGSSFNLKYDLGNGANTAVHGGGSCQISLTYETDPAKLKDPASWQVIQSFVGGCPTNAMGNLDQAVMCNGSNGPNCVNALTFDVPADVKSGNALFAWTWFNNVGNREMYMNCAKVSISGGSGTGTFPGMAVANLASINSCATTENFNTEFASPGQKVVTANPLNYPAKLMQGSGCSGSSTGSTGGSAGGSTGGSTGGGAATTSASTPQTTQAPGSGSGTGSQGGNAGGVFAPGASGTPSTLVTSVAAAPTSAPATGGSTGSSTPATSGSQGACTNGQVACTASGFYCISTSQFGMCAFGCATPMQMAAGTECSGGAVQAIATPQRRKRSLRHLHARAHDHVSPLL